MRKPSLIKSFLWFPMFPWLAFRIPHKLTLPYFPFLFSCGFQNTYSIQIRLVFCLNRHCLINMESSFLCLWLVAYCYSFLNDQSFKFDPFKVLPTFKATESPTFSNEFSVATPSLPGLLSSDTENCDVVYKTWLTILLILLPLFVNCPVWISFFHLLEGKLLQSWSTFSLYIFLPQLLMCLT